MPLIKFKDESVHFSVDSPCYMSDGWAKKQKRKAKESFNANLRWVSCQCLSEVWALANPVSLSCWQLHAPSSYHYSELSSLTTLRASAVETLGSIVHRRQKHARDRAWPRQCLQRKRARCLAVLSVRSFSSWDCICHATWNWEVQMNANQTKKFDLINFQMYTWPFRQR